MKKIIYLLIPFLFISCQEEEKWNNSEQDIRVTASLPATRTFFTEDGNVTHVSWEEEDIIHLYTKEQSDLCYYANETSRDTEFHFYSDKLKAADGDSVYACYGGWREPDTNPFHVNLPGTQWQYSGVGHDFLYAANVVKGNQVSLQFKHLFAFLKITIPTELITEQIGYEPNEETNGLYIKSTEEIGISLGYFDLQKGEIVSAETHDKIFCTINTDTILSKKEVTYYIAILPQSEEAVLDICHFSIGFTDSRILTKKAPAGGFKAGNVYTLYINENETEVRRRAERESLIAFYKATNGAHWSCSTNWCSDKPFNEWYGIETDQYGCVKSILLNRNNLDGRGCEGIGLSVLCDITHLEGLNLSENPKLSGPIPAEIGNLTNLQGLGLSGSNITGKLPKEFTNLTKLYSLGLAENNLEGEFPDLTFLEPDPDDPDIEDRFSREYDISDNKFTGKLPNIPNSEKFHLRYFIARNNKFTGTIPRSHIKELRRNISDWSSVLWDCSGEDRYRCEYDVSYNNLSGKLPDEIATHENFHIYWFNILPQNQGYGFDRVDIPAHANTVKCYDGSFVNLGEEYKKNEYTILFRWDPYCPYSAPYPPRFESLRQKYQKQGLGIIGMTPGVYSNEELKPFTEKMPETKIFWEVSEQHWHEDLGWQNNPYCQNKYFFLFRYGDTPLFFIIDKQGNIIYYGSDVAYPGTVPQHHEDRDDIFKFVANLFGDDDFVPEAPEYYTSSDYSRDGEVLTLQKATVGKGIDLVFMGEAFTDRDMEPGGKYEQKMKEAMEQYFAFEPYKSFRNRFNVYAVKVVSPNEEFALDAVRRINEDDGVCIEYAQKVPNIDRKQWRISVIYNTGYSIGRSYTRMYTDRSFVGYMMEGVNDVLNHESGGHGFAKLLDEYIEPGNEYLTLPKDGQEALDYQWQEFGWGANVDWRNDRNTVKWSHLLNDSRYANEGLGLYEGAFLYGYGAYRPTMNSMMRYNDTPFNAPSREQIYKCIMQQSEGEGWTYNYEDFVKYDAINRNNATTRSLKTTPSEKVRDEWKKRHRPPVFVNGTWRDAVKKRQTKNSTIVPLR